MRHILTLFIITLFVCRGISVSAESGEKSTAEKRFSRELAVIDYFNNYRKVPGERSSRYLLKKLLNELKKRGQVFNLESPSIFNPEYKSKRELYKRIYIPVGSHCFSEKMYRGMADYVKSGGLLITNCAMVYVDVNGDGEVGKNDKLSLLSETLVTGIRGRQGGKVNQLKSIVKCPLTTGLEDKKWQSIANYVYVRKYIKASNAKVLALCQEVDKTGASLSAPKPFLSFRHEGHGACVFIAGKMSPAAFKTKLISQLFDNLFNNKTLNWLCLQK